MFLGLAFSTIVFRFRVYVFRARVSTIVFRFGLCAFRVRVLNHCF